MRVIIRVLFLAFSIVNRACYKLVAVPIKRTMLAQCGRNVFIGKSSLLTYKNIFIGNNVFIGNYAMFLSTVAKIKIGNNIMFGPHVYLITGDHRIDILGKYMIDVKDLDKLPENDKDIIIQDDVWIGANSIILKGVTIGEGSVIAAGSVVVKDVEPYSIYAGVPAKKINSRFSEKQVREHKRILKLSKGK